jgi:hypothetical protein
MKGGALDAQDYRGRTDRRSEIQTIDLAAMPRKLSFVKMQRTS